MKKLLSVFGFLALSGCAFYADEDGVAVYGREGLASISTGSLVTIIVVGLLVFGLTGWGIYAYMIKNAKNQMKNLEEKLKKGEISKEEFDACSEKYKKFIK